jgi:non-ribosomal peptide synthetase component F
VDHGSSEFWRDYLRDAAVSRIGMDAPASARRIVIKKALDARMIQELSARASEAGVPLRTVFLAAHTCVLARFCAPGDFFTGVFAHGRPETPGSDETLGLFLNFLPLRLRRPPSTWREAIRAVQEQESTIFPHRRCSIFAASPGGEIPFDSIFNYVNFHGAAQTAHAADMPILSTDAINVNEFAWNTVLRQSGAELQLEVHFDPARIREVMVTTAVGAIEEALDIIKRVPDTAIAAHYAVGL